MGSRRGWRRPIRATTSRIKSGPRPKIRQQLQVLRDKGWLAFNGRGTYRRT
ncbi:hypothetical protein [Brevundimonas sp.]|uniref:hypothetical protein n=1 Tax=Brevundimonas sp. TaxID=1871086 RepID=UPI003784FF41